MIHAGAVSGERAWIAQVASVFEYLWVTGLAFVVLSLSSCLPCKDVVSDTAIYLCMGTVFPAAAFLVYLCERSTFLNRIATGLKILFVLYACYQFRNYWISEASIFTFFAFPVLSMLIVLPYWLSQTDRESPQKRWASAFLIFAISLVCWVAAQNLEVGAKSFGEWIVEYWRVMPILIAATVLTAAALLWQDEAPSRKKWRWAGHLLALCLFAGLSVQTDSLHDYRVYDRCGFGHHWAFWIGPVESVRDGHWLLWDVPSQYGFLNILTIAAMPISDAWESMYAVQSTLLFIVAAMVYGLLIRWGSRLHNYLFAVLLTVAAVFLLPGLIPEALSGVQPWPNIGPLRYFWLLISVGVMWYFLDGKTPRIRHYLWVGSFCWVMGILWSFESGAFCSAVFVSVTCVLMLQEAVRIFQAQKSWRASLGACLPFIMVPVGMLFFAVAVIWTYYRVYLGTGPDWLGYCEYALIHVGNESLTSPLMTVQNRAEVLIATACIFATIVIWKLKANSLSPQVALALGAWFAFWDSLLLFVTLKHPPFSDSGTVFALTLGIFVPLLNRLSNPLLSRLVRYALLPIIAFLFTITYGHPDFPRVIKALQWPETHLAQTMCPIEPSACLLLDFAGLGTEASLVCDYQGRLLLPPRHQDRKEGPYTNRHSWLPQPIVMFLVLPAARQDVYIERWINRVPDGGWLLIERPKRPRENRINSIHSPFLPKVINRLRILPFNHWEDDLRSSVFRRTAWREVTRQWTVHKGRALITQLRDRYEIQKMVENEHWALYRCVPRKTISASNQSTNVVIQN